LPAFSRLDPASSARSFVSSFALVFTAGAFVAALLAPLAVPVVTFLYGSKWFRSASVLALLAVFGALRVVFDLTATFLIARGGSRPVLLVQIAWVGALVPAMIVGVHTWGIVGAGGAHVAVALAVVLPAYVLALRRQGVRVAALLRAAGPPLGAAVVAGAAAWGCGQAVTAGWHSLLFGCAVGVLLYLALLGRWVRPRLAAG
jgi:PST family polysaccharide transporter